MDLAKYSWWGESNEPPEHLKTKKQLGELGLSPLKAVAVIKTQKYDVLLYDPNNPECCRPKRKSSPKQLETLAANRLKAQIKRDYREWYREVGFIERDRVRAVKWAREQLTHNNWVFLDTETTGLDDAEIVEIAIVDRTEETLLDTLIKPSIPIPPEAAEFHGITDEMVVDAPSFPTVYPRIAEILKDKRILIYNAEFDIKILNYCCHLHHLPILKLKKRSECLMEWAAQWGGDWSYYYKDYKYFPLPSGNHRALGDCTAAFELIKLMAADSDRINCPVPIPESKRKSKSQ
ncbi:MAG: 3'-5' exonuclease [Microcoleus sp. PH2017_25_DOB_D_A]|uniref:3'-5' exonuclease n=1 Tax=unclassified Microcoleus TaxID=2642155 RepID=UPI001DECA2B4|nr:MULTISPECIES: 3'-5' exonuclease [unclassified Microcoleus]MCC3498336.1 3'-5' exonuclease [Microcoleus sp. PH2017_15_JOR_U_A]MCC3509519.1 3'-5' exonuclease [Microcoleus sp. PH2017_17_BER_D_A]MCC3535569.1 3'-5' exonuclease [Microcoleus sp. PH2017_25_DOB_D_A]MCC3545462.1 3'-5' exonuclease [Microcoleus sp. PH2017_24_DOB_U_A]